MACLGVHFAITSVVANKLLALAGNDDGLLEFIQEEIEEEWDVEWLAQSDKAWDAIHRCLTDGHLHFNAKAPRGLCVIGGQQLYAGDDYIISFVTANQVSQVAAAIKDIDEAWMRERYFQMPTDSYPDPLTEEDFGYTWSWFEGVQSLFQKAAAAGRAMVFTVDQ